MPRISVSDLWCNYRISKSTLDYTMNKLKNNTVLGTEQLLNELFDYGVRGLTSAIHKIIGAIEWVDTKRRVVIATFKKGDKTNCTNYRGTSILLTC